jgi:hypothetical protein
MKNVAFIGMDSPTISGILEMRKKGKNNIV